MDNALHFTGSDLLIDEADLSPELAEALKDCGVGGRDASPSVTYVRENFEITGDAEACRKMLRGYGAWSDDELSDHSANLDRLVWLTGCSLAEGEPAYFSGY